jgi:hypothetical protein
MTKKHVLTIALILAGVFIVGFFGMRAVRAFKRMQGHSPFHGKPPAAYQLDVATIREWMTVPFIAHTYNVPPDAIFKNLEIPKNSRNGKMSLAQLNKEYYPDQPGAVLAQVQALLQAFQKQDPPPHFPATPVLTPAVTATP